MDNNFYRWQNNHLHLFCQLQAKASKDEFAGIYVGETIGGRAHPRLKIRISAPPIDGKANQQLIKFLAKQFAVAKSAISIDSGELGKQKHVIIQQPRQLPTLLTIEKPG